MNVDHTPNSTANTADFEFSALEETYFYPRAIVEEFRPYLSGHLVEVGAGIGQLTSRFSEVMGPKNITAVEPDAGFAQEFRRRCPHLSLIEGTVANLPPDIHPGAIVSVNVIEHIPDHIEEMARYRAILAPQKGYLCMLAPARPEIYAPLDKDFGHFRRYTRTSMKEALQEAGFRSINVFYFNFCGYFAWLLNFKLLGSRSFNPKMVRFYDRMIFKTSHPMEKFLMRPPIGQSVIAIAQA